MKLLNFYSVFQRKQLILLTDADNYGLNLPLQSRYYGASVSLVDSYVAMTRYIVYGGDKPPRNWFLIYLT